MATQKSAQHRFGELVKDQREQRRPRWTQRELADRLADKGINMHWTTIAKIEKGQRQVGIHEAAAFADVFKCSVDALLGRRPRLKGDLLFVFRRLSETLSQARWTFSSTASSLREQSDELAEIDDDGRFAAFIAQCREVADACAAPLDAIDSIEFAGGVVGRATKAMLRAWLEEEGQNA